MLIGGSGWSCCGFFVHVLQRVDLLYSFFLSEYKPNTHKNEMPARALSQWRWQIIIKYSCRVWRPLSPSVEFDTWFFSSSLLSFFSRWLTFFPILCLRFPSISLLTDERRRRSVRSRAAFCRGSRWYEGQRRNKRRGEEIDMFSDSDGRWVFSSPHHFKLNSNSSRRRRMLWLLLRCSLFSLLHFDWFKDAFVN